MNADFNVFDPSAPGGAEQAQRAQQARQQRHAAVHAALSHPAGRAWLNAMLAEAYARPSYAPGDTFDAVAYREGRTAVLREIAQDLHAADQPTHTGE
ncbi:hypothetical protein GXW78_16875 [Roseomonas terrae]|uniref:Uncharacterized protein n=1 Tax=Neoroseomonas terrae TaxID=424799 RepID=A0ABS5EJY6_9PROT|nr:hypothetical protein [Neoroseomonas terrae]MBR0651349.1 hypothetical protein [Neoroseomonas terrae]